MAFLVAGVALFAVVHLFPSVAPAARGRLAERLGENLYKGLFAIDLVIALALIVYGWKTAIVQPLYAPPLLGSPAVTVLVFIAFYLFAAANAPGNAKRIIRHPMLTGTVVWAAAHLLANGENRSVVLFGGIGLWALLSIFTINRRDGAYEKPGRVAASRDAMTVVATAVVFAIVLYGHQWAFGVSPLPGR
jgi:uncharacterized membrane protein